MKRRRKVKLDLLSGHAVAVFLLGALFLLGGAVGCIIAGGIHGEAGNALQEYLKTYFTLAEGNTVEVHFWAAVWEQLRFPLAVLFLGFTAIGVVGIPVLFAVRGFVFTFCVACFCRLFGASGLLPAIFLFGLPALVWAPALFVLGIQALGGACSMLCRCMGDDRDPVFFDGTYWGRCALCGGAVALCVALEYWVLPVLVGACAKFVL